MKIGPLELGGNVWCLGPLYVSGARTNGGGWPIQRTWVNEPEPPWRYGQGIGVRLPFRCMLTVGLWWRQDVQVLADRVTADVAAPATIEDWLAWDEEVRQSYREACDDGGDPLYVEEWGGLAVQGWPGEATAEEGRHGTASAPVVQGGDQRSPVVG